VALARGLHLFAKGEPDLLTDGTSTFQNYHHHAAQTVRGVGDVVGGVLGSLLGQGLAPLHAGRLASYWVGDAGVRAGGRRGWGMVATDVVEELPNALVAGLDRIARSL
jgi:NAD(P)H-hydrate epimerase